MQSESCQPVSAQPDTPVANYRTEIVLDLAEVPAADWDALVAAQPDATPFLRHAFLHAMHTSGSATDDTGWSPRFLTLWVPNGHGAGRDRLAAAMPLYAKSHSYGEYGDLCTIKASDQLTE
ncbi:hypothetical protein D3C86_1840850 [compost metagenome]